jgi:hypothetical protein
MNLIPSWWTCLVREIRPGNGHSQWRRAVAQFTRAFLRYWHMPHQPSISENPPRTFSRYLRSHKTSDLRVAFPIASIVGRPITLITASLNEKAFNFDAFVRFWGVNRQINIHRLLAVLMIAGLALAPFSQPVMAGAPSDASMQAMVDEMSPSATMDEMANDMPCCPSKAPAPVDCDKCVFMSACMSNCFTGMLATVSHPFPTASDGVANLQNESRPDGLGRPPPEHPPRILV